LGGSWHLSFFDPQHFCSAKSCQLDRSHASSIAVSAPVQKSA
jgi:hypothetical protein